MDENSAEAMGLAAFVAMEHLLAKLDEQQPGFKNEVITKAITELNGGGSHIAAIVTNLNRL